MHDEQAESGAQVADPLGDRLKMSEARFQRTREMGTSTNSSSPTEKVSESPRTNGSTPEPTPIAPVVNLASWLSSPEAAQFFTSLSRDPERPQEFQLRLYVSTYGKTSHMHKTAASILRDLYVKGMHVHTAFLDDEEITEKYVDSEGRLWYDSKYNGSVVLSDNPLDV